MSRGGCLNKLQSKAVVRLLQHVKGLSKAQVSEDVHGEVVAPVGHVARRRPALGVGRGNGAAGGRAKLLAKGADVAENVALHLLHGAFGKGVGEHAALAGVDLLVAGVVGIGGRVDKGIVEFSLADVGAEAVDFLERRVGVEADAVGAEANNLALEGGISGEQKQII